MNAQNELYDIRKYTENELFTILDMNESATDRELEASILHNIRKYENMANNGGKMLHTFFKKIYNHFFEVDDEEDEDEEDEDEENIIEGMATGQSQSPSPSQTITITNPPAPQSAALDYVSNLQYSQGKLNPILKETIKRIISIDSQYREISVYPSSTNYTFNLSDTLNDVVSIKLYSVQIPYTWYTIDGNFGANFFYIKGNSPGINDGYDDYKIPIETGNYTVSQLSAAVSTSIQTLKTQINDVSFGTTDLIFNPINIKSSIVLDIKKFYGESYYELFFPDWSNPTEQSYRLLSVAGFLGYNKNQYNPTIAYSMPIPNIYTTSDSTLYIKNIMDSSCTIDNSNNFFKIYLYNGIYQANITSSIQKLTYTDILNKITDFSSNIIPITTYVYGTGSNSVYAPSPNILITLSIPNGTHTIQAVMNNLNTQLSNNSRLQNSSISFNPVSNLLSGSETYNSSGCFNLQIILNRNFADMNNENLKVAIDFGMGDLWAGQNSTFKFITSTPTHSPTTQIAELNGILSETPVPKTTYYFTSNPTINLICDLSGYDNNLNDFVITVQFPTSYDSSAPSELFTGPFYTYNSYRTAYTTAIQTGNIKYSSDLTSISTNNFSNNIIINTNAGGINGISNTQFNFSHNFSNQDYFIDLSSSILYTQYGFPRNTNGNTITINSYSMLAFSTNAVTDSNNKIYINNTDGSHVHTIQITDASSASTFFQKIDTSFSALNDISLNIIYKSTTTNVNTSSTTISFCITLLISSNPNRYTIDLTDSILCTKYNFYPLTIPYSSPYIRCSIPYDGTRVYNTSYNNNNITITSINSRANTPIKRIYCSNALVSLNRQTEILSALKTYFDISNTYTNPYLIGYVNTSPSKILDLSWNDINQANGANMMSIKLSFNINTKIDQTHYKAKFIDASNTWINYFDLSQNKLYDLSSSTVPTVLNNNLLIVSTINNYFYLRPIYNTSGGVYTTTDNLNTNPFPKLPYKYNDLIYKICNFPPNSSTYTYNTVEELIYDISTALLTQNQVYPQNTNVNTEIAQNSVVSLTNSNPNNRYTLIRPYINKIFTSTDYRIVFYDIYSFVYCNITGKSGAGSIQNVNWDSTLGWMLGFRTETEYIMSYANSLTANPNVSPSKYYYDSATSTAYPSSGYSIVDSLTSIANISTLVGDTAVNVSLYNYFMIILDDYTQNHLNDGLITSVTKDMDIALPSYANKSNQRCDPVTGEITISSTGLTQKQIYSAIQILSQQKIKQQSISSGPFIQDVFALVPIKTTGLSAGATYIEFGGSLQLQDRTYFGPVNIRRMTVKLINDKGEIVDLNNANWSFSLICEQLYNPNPQK
jgi:hypothetical protein